MKGLLFITAWLIATVMHAAVIEGTVIDKETREPLIGATVQIKGTTTGAVTDIDGKFKLAGVRNGTHEIVVSYISYRTQTISVEVANITNIEIEMATDAQLLNEVVIVGQVKKNTETSIITQQKTSLVVQSGVSAQQITRTQDKDASEVIRRIPGISIIDEKFVMVRGLSQRYNNVWINKSAVPSSEADARAFSFDIIPSSQLDNMVVVKSPSPEYPADFTGGFILINTKDVPNENTFGINIGGSINDRTHFRKFFYNEGSGTDFLGFDNGLRSLNNGIKTILKPSGNGEENNYGLLNNNLNNDWTIKRKSPVSDLSLSMNFSHRWTNDNGNTWAMLGVLNYSNNYKTYLDMDNNLFGGYDTTNDHPNYLRQYKDNQYNHNARLGAMMNFTYVTADGNSRYELKNIFNQLGKDRYTYRKGYDAQNDYEEQAEYYYQSRSTYNGQFTGKHIINDENHLDWSIGYSYANRNMPDRRRFIRVLDEDKQQFTIDNLSDVNREFSRLNEHIASANVNYQRTFHFDNFDPMLKVGGYSEYRTRNYNTRFFLYTWNNGRLPQQYATMDIPNQLMHDENYGSDKLSLLEKVDYTNNYDGNNFLGAGYIGMNLPFGKVNVYAGVRFEHNKMELISNTRQYEESKKSTFYTYNDFFPSVNTTYKLDDKQQFRLSYGRSVNRPEFREVSTSVFYDFDLASNVEGNAALKPAYIDNVDLTYELYPSIGELVSVGFFYKHFKNPIEWVYTLNGGTDYTYSNINAESATNYGVEVDIRKSLDFIGLRNFSLSFNGALIKSKVHFPEGAREKSRPMQGQSPYLINTGIFYQSENKGWNAAIMYNRIGKRIVGVGRSMGTGDNIVNVPDSYEMPRNAIDLNVSKKFGEHIEIKFAVRDLLAEHVVYQQFQETNHGDVKQINRKYKPGRNFNLNFSYQF